MTQALGEIDFERLWKRLQQIGLNGYESRSYLVLIGHPRFKALELAARARVPRQKIYEVLESLVEKGFAQVVQEKTKLFSAVQPTLAVPSYLNRRQEILARELHQQEVLAEALIGDLNAVHANSDGRGTLDYLRIVSEPAQSGVQYRSMLSEVKSEYLEFSRPPYAVDPLEEQLVKQARLRGVSCRLLMEQAPMDARHRVRLHEYSAAGVEVRQTAALPMKLALFDGKQGLIALLDPVVTRPTWTSVVFDHCGMGEAMKGLFEEHWRRGAPVEAGNGRAAGA